MRKLLVTLTAALALVVSLMAVAGLGTAAHAAAPQQSARSADSPVRAAERQSTAKKAKAKKKAKKKKASRRAEMRNWNRLAWCESTGRWRINSGNGYYGGLQISPSTWRAFGGKRHAALPHKATKKQQIKVARKIRNGQGWGAWPSCSRKLGLR